MKRNKSYTSTEVGVLLEDLHGKFDLLAEGQAGTNTRLDRLETKFDDMDVRAGGLEIRFTGLEYKFDVMLKELSGQRKDIDELKGDMKDVKRLVIDHDKRIISLELTAKK